MAQDPAPPNALDLTSLLRAWSGGDGAALERLAPAVQAELKRIASRYTSRERKGHTLQPTALVNEVFLRLIDSPVQWQDRAHFFALSAQMMRRILVNYALARGTHKRGGPAVRVTLDEGVIAAPDRSAEILELDEALRKLASIDSRKAQVVELRFFAGLSVDETAEVLRVSPQTVLRDWNLSKTWLAREMSRQARA